MRRCLLWVAMSPNGYTFRVGCRSSKRECLGPACSLDSCNLAACGHWWHLDVHFQDMLGKPSRKMFWYRQKWGFLEPSEEMNKWWDRSEMEATVEGLRCKLSYLFANWLNKRVELSSYYSKSIETIFFYFCSCKMNVEKWRQQPSGLLYACRVNLIIFKLFVRHATFWDL